MVQHTDANPSKLALYIYWVCKTDSFVGNFILFYYEAPLKQTNKQTNKTAR